MSDPINKNEVENALDWADNTLTTFGRCNVTILAAEVRRLRAVVNESLTADTMSEHQKALAALPAVKI